MSELKKQKTAPQSNDLIGAAQCSAKLKIVTMLKENVSRNDQRRFGVSTRLVDLLSRIGLYVVNELSFATFWNDIYFLPNRNMPDHNVAGSRNEQQVNDKEEHSSLARQFASIHNNDHDRGVLMASQYLSVISCCVEDSAILCVMNYGTYLGYVAYCCNVAFTSGIAHILRHEQLFSLVNDTPIPSFCDWWDEVLKEKPEDHRMLPTVSLRDTSHTVYMCDATNEYPEGRINSLFEAMPLRTCALFMSDVREAATILASNDEEKNGWITKLDGMQHGDVVRTDEYRGCGTYLLDRSAQQGWKIRNLPALVLPGVLVRTFSEYGEVIPFNFADLENTIPTLIPRVTYTRDVYVDLTRMIGKPQLVVDRVGKVKAGEPKEGNDPNYVMEWTEDPIDMTEFPHNYIAVCNGRGGCCVFLKKRNAFELFGETEVLMAHTMNARYRIFSYIYDVSYKELVEPLKDRITDATSAAEIHDMIADNLRVAVEQDEQ